MRTGGMQSVVSKLGGRYEVGEELAAHGSVHVYRALDAQSGRPVIIRTMPTNAGDLEAFIRFQEEGAVLSSLEHPNIWRVYATFIDGDVSCIVVEAVEGKTLTEVLRPGRLPLGRAKLIGLQVVAALIYAHRHRVLHRDLNPEHVFIQEGDHVKVRDLNERGMARILRQGFVPNPSPGSSILYASPEQIDGRPVDPRTDVYSLGAVLYHMVSGRPPLRGPLAFPADVSPDWRALIAKAMAQDPRYRYQTAEEIGAALAQLPPPEVTMPVFEEQPEGRRCPRCGRMGKGEFCAACGARLVDV